MAVTLGAKLEKEIEFRGQTAHIYRHSNGRVTFWFSADEYPDILALKPGTFEDTSWFKPVAHLWVRSAQPWVILDSSTPQYEKQPEISELIELWASREKA